MVIELWPLQIDLGGKGAEKVGEPDLDMSDYTVRVTYRDPPSGYEQQLSTEGGTAIVFPPVPLWRALLQALVALLLLAWMWVLIQGGMGMFSVIFALVAAYSLLRLVVQCSTRTSLLVGDHRILRRRSLAGLPASETEFMVDHLEIDNGVWNTGRGSTDTLTVVTAYGRYTLESTEATVSKANRTGELWWKRVSALGPHRVEPEPGRPSIATDVLHLGQFLASHANVPLAVVVRRVPEPDYGD